MMRLNPGLGRDAAGERPGCHLGPRLAAWTHAIRMEDFAARGQCRRSLPLLGPITVFDLDDPVDARNGESGRQDPAVRARDQMPTVRGIAAFKPRDECGIGPSLAMAGVEIFPDRSYSWRRDDCSAER